MPVIREFGNDPRSFRQLLGNAVKSLVRAQFRLYDDMMAFPRVEPVRNPKPKMRMAIPILTKFFWLKRVFKFCLESIFVSGIREIEMLFWVF